MQPVLITIARWANLDTKYSIEPFEDADEIDSATLEDWPESAGTR